MQCVLILIHATNERFMNQLKIEIGDTVRIAKTSKYYNCQYVSNPRCEGVYTEWAEQDSVPFMVEWANGYTNQYSLKDLTLIKKGKKDMKEFTKSDLKTGMFVKLRDGSIRIIINDGVCGFNFYGSLKYYNQSLIKYLHGQPEANYDIMAVYTEKHNNTFSAYLKGESLTLIWERTEQTEAQKEMEVLQEQAKALQEQITKLQGKL